MSNHLKFCGCHLCRRGRHTETGSEIVKRPIRKFCRAAKQKLKKGEKPEFEVSVPYTD